MSSSRGSGSADTTGRIRTLHRHLHDALNLGTRFNEGDTKKWMCTDNETQRRVARSIAAFLEAVPRELLQHHLVKDSVPDIVYSLVWILQEKNEAASSIAADATVKLVSVIPNALLKPFALDLGHALSCLLSSPQVRIVVSCATALNTILSSLTSKSEEACWVILEKAQVIAHLIFHIRDVLEAVNPTEYIQPLHALLSTILSRWPLSRFLVWSNAKLMESLDYVYAKPDFSIRAVVLKLYAAIALCGIGAKKLLEQRETFFQEIVQCMGSPHPRNVRIEAFRLAQCLVINEQKGLELISLCCEPIVREIISGMTDWVSQPALSPNNQMPLLEEACRLALITRWTGQHHNYFWKHRIGDALLYLLLAKHNITQEALKNYIPRLEAYAWEILGWLATNFDEDLDVDEDLNGHSIDTLISHVCCEFVESFTSWRQISQSDVVNASKYAVVSRVIMLMLYSPSKYIASKTTSTLTERLEPYTNYYLKDLWQSMNSVSSGTLSGMSNIFLVINVLCLICCMHLPKYTVWDEKGEGVKALLSFIKWCSSSEVYIDRPGFSPDLHFSFHEKTCCWVLDKEWEGRDIILLYSLVGLGELIFQLKVNERDISSLLVGFTEGELISMLQGICSDSSSPGLKWYAAYTLSFFGFYGLPCKFGNRIGKALDEMNYSDIQFVFKNGDSINLNAHGSIVAARCASLLPSYSDSEDAHGASDSSTSTDLSNISRKIQKKITLSADVDHGAMVKLLEYVYCGFVHAEDGLAKKLRNLASVCSLQPLLQHLSRKIPKWGMPFPSFNLKAALGPAGDNFSDIILVAKTMKQTDWKCFTCSLSAPHKHVHKVILWLSCHYLWALQKSGMKESGSPVIDVPVSWEAMDKLVDWFYSDMLPEPPSGCLWNKMDNKEKLNEVQLYVELCWLADFWILEDVWEVCFQIVVDGLKSDRLLSIDVIRMAADFSLWTLAEIAADYLAPLYSQLRTSGALEALDEKSLDMIRVASVRLSQRRNDS